MHSQSLSDAWVELLSAGFRMISMVDGRNFSSLWNHIILSWHLDGVEVVWKKIESHRRNRHDTRQTVVHIDVFHRPEMNIWSDNI